MKIKYYIALWAAKISILGLKITKHGGTNFPGVVALKICPEFLKYVDKPEKIIGITGTNGKTTTINMVVDVLETDGKKVLNNRDGANVNTGIATAFVYGMTTFGKCKYDMAVLEIDERSSIRIFPYIQPDYMIITNLTCDSVIRNAHPEYIKGFLDKYTPEKTTLILNADDLISSSVAQKNKRVYYGISKLDRDKTECINLRNDCQICPVCSHKLKYEYLRYHHIGKAYCESCGFKSPEYDFNGKNIDVDNMTVDVEDCDGTGTYAIPNDSIHNIYNVVSVVALLRTLGYSQEKLQKLLGKINILSSRYHEVKIGNNSLTYILSKDMNAIGSSRVFEYIRYAPGNKEVLLLNNELLVPDKWSENICWYYDCDFEFLNDDSIKNIVVYGNRRYDLKLRLKLAGVADDRISLVEKPEDAPTKLKCVENDQIYILYGTDTYDMCMDMCDDIKAILKEKTEDTDSE